MATLAAKRGARRFDSPEQEAYLALWRTYDRLRALEDELFAGFDLTAQQYNLLRLLRAAHEPIPTLAVAERLVSRGAGHHTDARPTGEGRIHQPRPLDQ